MGELGPFTFTYGRAGNHRRIPKVAPSRVDGSYLDGDYVVGVWVSWLGRQVGVNRNRWWIQESTWRNQLWCRARGHQPLTVVTDAELTGATPEAAEVRILNSHVKCRRCGLVLEGPQWVTR